MYGSRRNLIGHLGAGRWQGALEVGQRLSFPRVQLRRDHVDHDVLAPAVLKRRSEVPLPNGPVLDPVQNPEIVTPGQFGNKLLQNLRLRPGLGESAHVAEVPGAESFDTGERGLQVL